MTNKNYNSSQGYSIVYDWKLVRLVTKFNIDPMDWVIELPKALVLWILEQWLPSPLPIIVTTLDDTVTDEQIPSAKAVHTAIQNVSVGVPADVYSKTEVDNLLATNTTADQAYAKQYTDELFGSFKFAQNSDIDALFAAAE
mgnify:CR=1 FL=1